MKDTYIKASFDLLTSGQSVDLVLENLKKTMTKKGHGSLWNSVLQGLVQKIEQVNIQTKPQVVVAKPADLDPKVVEKLLKELGSQATDFNTIIDPTMVGGMKVSHNYRQVDGSYKTKLQNLYQAIVAKS